ncbi:hypothetical protein BGW36DRAFT_383767 [Talaromyces proteolyticus]|uniref:Stress-response A/B barrel domain-containing protein n=1 Tax=Talaromyces proteolyticus TaxID=1131652 RepID=A0AAD4PTQ9_9EURO|nr:uncharacterized protein BGW36DRAFT_383767 [Talaromyces proteolyticus]KAH8693803.1 hypothetical protein BGW36DRAFT_383767 [Talaromyces proteolyticus]
MAIVHIVLFQYKESTSLEDVENASAQVLALKDNCLHPITQKPYIKSFVGGKDHSPENAQHGMTHGFVAEFASLEDRDYYVSTDPVHLALGRQIGPLVEKFQCVDFTNGILT